MPHTAQYSIVNARGWCMYVRISVCPCTCVCICIYMYKHLHVSTCIYLHLSAFVCIDLHLSASVCLSVCPSPRLSACLSTSPLLWNNPGNSKMAILNRKPTTVMCWVKQWFPHSTSSLYSLAWKPFSSHLHVSANSFLVPWLLNLPVNHSFLDHERRVLWNQLCQRNPWPFRDHPLPASQGQHVSNHPKPPCTLGFQTMPVPTSGGLPSTMALALGAFQGPHSEALHLSPLGIDTLKFLNQPLVSSCSLLFPVPYGYCNDSLPAFHPFFILFQPTNNLQSNLGNLQFNNQGVAGCKSLDPWRGSSKSSSAKGNVMRAVFRNMLAKLAYISPN